MTTIRFLSLGRFCQTAHQIRRFTKTQEANFFDWFIIDYKAVARVLENDFSGVFLRENLEISKDGKSVLDKATRIVSFHDFGHDDAGLTTNDVIDQNYERVLGKLDFLANRWRSIVSSNDVVFFVHHGDMPQNEAENFSLLLKRLYPKITAKLLWVRWPGADSRTPIEDVVQTVVRSAPPGPQQWAGMNEDWNESFECALASIDRKILA